MFFGLVSVLANAQSHVSDGVKSYDVAENSFLRMPSTQKLVTLQRLDVGRQGTVLIPAQIEKLVVEQLTLASLARLSIAPRETAFELLIKRAQFADGSTVSARGSDGDVGVPGGRGADLHIEIVSGHIDNLIVDTRGGRGGDGWEGMNGESGRDAACWGLQAGMGRNGQDGGNGLPGGDGGNITVVLGEPEWLDVIDFLQIAGIGGQGGRGGQAGAGGDAADCWAYSVKASYRGKAGEPGVAAHNGSQGILRVQ